jgi:hypothetical protein
MRRKHVLGKYSGLYIGLFPAKIIRDQAELFQGGFEVVDDFLGDDAKYELWEMVPDTFPPQGQAMTPQFWSELLRLDDRLQQCAPFLLQLLRWRHARHKSFRHCRQGLQRLGHVPLP